MFVERCRAAALAVTPQRLAIFRELAATDRHPSAEELHAAVRREMPTLSLATVYKTLDTLAVIGAVRPVSRLGARGRWDANLEPHHHLVCTACGDVSDVTEPALDEAARQRSTKTSRRARDGGRAIRRNLIPGKSLVKETARLSPGRTGASVAAHHGRRPP